MSDVPERKRLKLVMQPGDVLPQGMSWLLLDGYVRTVAWDEDGEMITLGLWGPGEWFTTAYSALATVELRCLSAVALEEFKPNDQQVRDFLQLQLRATEQIFEINRIRGADQRMLALLRWISTRFGQVNSHGHRLSLRDMNLTHKALAELSGLTRVTVTKTLNRFKALGVIQSVGDADLLIRY
jgi:CRP-like cAMP-binding protein